MLTVKMSATKKKSAGLELGVMTVKVSMELRVALMRMVEQVVPVFLGRLNWVMP
jgi:phosphoglycolate phosphatase-like HAD superfamily hydrolase